MQLVTCSSISFDSASLQCELEIQDWQILFLYRNLFPPCQPTSHLSLIFREVGVLTLGLEANQGVGSTGFLILILIFMSYNLMQECMK
jgi:hypothetical protein